MCIQVDEVVAANTKLTGGFWKKESATSYNTNCGAIEIAIQDTNFEQALIDLGKDTNGLNGNILLSDAQAIDSLKIGNPITNTLIPNVFAKITDITGIAAMSNLKYLDVRDNEIASVDLSQNTALVNVSIGTNLLTTIDVSANVNLTSLFVNDNQLTTIDVTSNTALERFGIMRNQFTSIDISTLSNIKDLFVHGNQLTALDISNKSNLNWLYAYDNQITSLDLSNKPNLVRLYIWNNQISSLDVSSSTLLERLYADTNKLSTIDLSNNLNLKISFSGFFKRSNALSIFFCFKVLNDFGIASWR